MLAGMLHGSSERIVGVWSWTPGRASAARERGKDAWRDVDQRLRSIAKQRAALDHEELTLIRRAVAVQLWRPLGMASMREYLERVMGYGPRVASDRLRVAEALEGLPVMDKALRSGELSYSAVRELTRIATTKTDKAWVAVARDLTLRQIEEMVAEREPGDAPTSKPKPNLRPRAVTMMLRPAEVALLREARLRIERERGERVDDGELITELYGRAFSDAKGGKRVPRPRHQIAITVCESCKQGWQRGGGRQIAITPVELATASCDAELLGSLDGPPAKTTTSIPAKVRNFVWHRDGGRCNVPGCRSAQNLDVHHIVFREDGGGNEPENLLVLCAGHHRALHDGALMVMGRAPEVVVRWRSEVPQPDPDEPAAHVGEPVTSLVPKQPHKRTQRRRSRSRDTRARGGSRPRLAAHLTGNPTGVSI